MREGPPYLLRTAATWAGCRYVIHCSRGSRLARSSSVRSTACVVNSDAWADSRGFGAARTSGTGVRVTVRQGDAASASAAVSSATRVAASRWPRARTHRSSCASSRTWMRPALCTPSSLPTKTMPPNTSRGARPYGASASSTSATCAASPVQLLAHVVLALPQPPITQAHVSAPALGVEDDDATGADEQVVDVRLALAGPATCRGAGSTLLPSAEPAAAARRARRDRPVRSRLPSRQLWPLLGRAPRQGDATRHRARTRWSWCIFGARTARLELSTVSTGGGCRRTSSRRRPRGPADR